MSDSGKEGMIDMESTIHEMQQKLTDGYCVGFLYANEGTRFLLGKSDEFHLLNENIINCTYLRRSPCTYGVELVRENQISRTCY